MKIKFSDRMIKKITAVIMSLAVAVSMVSTAGISAYAEEEEAPVLYLEVSSTLTAQDSFAWTAYDPTIIIKIIIFQLCRSILHMKAIILK